MNLKAIVIAGSAILSIVCVTKLVIPNYINTQGLHFKVRPKAKKRKKDENVYDHICVLNEGLYLENILHKISENLNIEVNEPLFQIGRCKIDIIVDAIVDSQVTLLFITHEIIHNLKWFKYKVNCNLMSSRKLVICIDQSLKPHELPKYLQDILLVSNKILTFTCRNGYVKNIDDLYKEVCDSIIFSDDILSSLPSDGRYVQNPHAIFEQNHEPLISHGCQENHVCVLGTDSEISDCFQLQLEERHLHICRPILGQYRFESICNVITYSSKIYVLVCPELMKDPLFCYLLRFAITSKGYENIVLVFSGRSAIIWHGHFDMALFLCKKTYIKFN